jgi:predicted transcriptional regulator
MADETIVEGEVREVPSEQKPGAVESAAARATAAASATAATFKGAFGSLGKVVSSALAARAPAVTVHLDEDALRRLDELVEGGITKDRSESAAFLIGEGIKANKDLFDRIDTIAEQIAALRAQLHQPAPAEPPTPLE